MSLASINNRIKQAEPNVELVRGDGYHYFVYDNESEGLYRTKSEYICYTSHLPDAE